MQKTGLWKCCAPLPPSIKSHVEREREIQPTPGVNHHKARFSSASPQGSQPTNPTWSRTTHLNPALDPDLQDFAQIKWFLPETTKSGWTVTRWNSQWPDVAGISAASSNWCRGTAESEAWTAGSKGTFCYHRPTPQRSLEAVTAWQAGGSLYSKTWTIQVVSKIGRDAESRTKALGQRCQGTQIQPHRAEGKGLVTPFIGPECVLATESCR